MRLTHCSFLLQKELGVVLILHIFSLDPVALELSVMGFNLGPNADVLNQNLYCN